MWIVCRVWITAMSLLLLLCGTARSQQEDKAKPEGGYEGPGEKPAVRMLYANAKGKFILDGDVAQGKYSIDGNDYNDRMKYTGSETIRDHRDNRAYIGWVYRVVQTGPDGKPVWGQTRIFFGQTPIRNRFGQAVYPMYYSIDGKGWYRILTNDGTRREKLDLDPPK